MMNRMMMENCEDVDDESGFIAAVTAIYEIMKNGLVILRLGMGRDERIVTLSDNPA